MGEVRSYGPVGPDPGGHARSSAVIQGPGPRQLLGLSPRRPALRVDSYLCLFPLPLLCVKVKVTVKTWPKASEAEAGGGERRGAKHRGGEPDPDPRSLACRVGAPRANLQARRDGPRVSPKMSSKIIGRTVSLQVRRATMSQNFVGPGVGAPRFWSRSRHSTAGGLCARHVVSLDHSFFLCWRYGMF